MRRERKNKAQGAFWSKAKGRWVVRVRQDGKRVEVGQFKTKARAEAVYAMAIVGDLDAARDVYEREKAENIAAEAIAAKERLAARREAKRLRDGHPYAMTYPFDEVQALAAVRYRGQVFQSLGQFETVSSRRKARITVDLWTTHCAVCGEPFEFRLLPKRDGQKPVPFWPVRRCETHRRAGASVRGATVHRRAAQGY